MNGYEPAPKSERSAIMINFRPVKEIFEMFGLKPDFFKNKKVLNAGAGTNDLAKELGINNIQTDVTNLDLDYDPNRKSWLWNLILKASRSQYPPKAVQGDTTKLPFVNESFDISISTSSLNDWITGERGILAFKELCRVTKDTVLVWPYSQKENAGLFKKLLSEVGSDFIIETPNDNSIRLIRKKSK